MKQFKEFLSEAPIDFGSEEEKESMLKHPEGEYQGGSFRSNFKKKYEVLGEGSSRIAFKVGVNAGLFKATDLKKVETGDDGQVQTAIKLGFNKKGMMQNRVELEIWQAVKNNPAAKYLCPIIDWSGNPRYKNNVYYEVNKTLVTKNGNLTAPFWIQMPLVKQYSWSDNQELWDAVKKEFGSEYVPDAHTPISDYDYMLRDGEITKQQHKNAISFIKLCEKFKLSDFHGDNIGMYKGVPVVLDYGFSDETQQVYWGHSQRTLKVEINDQGEVEISW